MEKEINNIGKALFNLQRFQILQTKINPQTNNRIHNAYAFAWDVKMFPLLHDEGLHEDLEQYFKITKKQVDIISKYADSEWLNKKLYNFYEYETHFGVRGSSSSEGIGRWALICVFRYMYLNGAFDQMFWEKLLEPMKYPSEAGGITSDYKTDDIYFV